MIYKFRYNCSVSCLVFEINRLAYFDQKQRAFRHLGYAFDMHTSQVYRVKSEIFILETTCHYQYKTRFPEVFLALN